MFGRSFADSAWRRKIVTSDLGTVFNSYIGIAPDVNDTCLRVSKGRGAKPLDSVVILIGAVRILGDGRLAVGEQMR